MLVPVKFFQKQKQSTEQNSKAKADADADADADGDAAGEPKAASRRYSTTSQTA